MSAAWQYYICTLLVYTGVNVIAVWGLNLQFGLGGILNFAFIIFPAAGAYTTAVLTLGPASATGGYEHYIIGARLPWPLPLLAAAGVGALLATVIGLFSLRPRRRDYQGLVLLTVSFICSVVVTSQVNLFNGATGLASIPHPLAGVLNTDPTTYGWFYVGLTAVVVTCVYGVVHRLTASPWGRTVRAMRENPRALQALGTNVMRRELAVFVIGGAIAAVSGAVLVQFVTAYSPSSFGIGETFIFFVCIIVGGIANTFGVALGVVVVLTGFVEGVQYLPFLSVGQNAEALQSVILGVLILVALYVRPRGLVPERRRVFAGAPRRRHESPAEPEPVPDASRTSDPAPST